MAMFEQKGGKPYHRNTGSILLLTVGLTVLLVLAGLFVQMLRIQLAWKDFQVQFALSVYDSALEDGWMKADDTHGAVRVCAENGQLVLRIMQTGKAGSLGRVKSEDRQIWLNFSDGTHGILSEVGDGKTHVDFTGLDGKRYQLYLGCRFDNLATLLSAQGAAYANEAWVDGDS